MAISVKRFLRLWVFMLLSQVVFAGSLLGYTEEGYKQLIEDCEKRYAHAPYDEGLKQELSALYHNFAMSLAEEGLWSEAIESSERAYAISPDVPKIREGLAYLYNCRGLEYKDDSDYKKAVDDLKRAIDYAPGEDVLKKNISGIYLSWAQDFFEKCEYDNAERMLVHVARYEEDNPYLYVIRGEIAYLRDNYYSTKENWQKALQLNPSLYNIRRKLDKLNKEQDIERNFSVREVENFKLKFEGMDAEKLADDAAEILRSAYRDVGKDFDLYPRATVPVIIYPAVNVKDLSYFPDWAAGSYDGKIRFREDLGNNMSNMKATLYHEYTHVLVRMLGGDNVPLWLNEGLAEYQAGRFLSAKEKKVREEMVQRAVEKDAVFSVDKLGNMDLNKLSYLSPHRITLVYAQSESFVGYMISRASLYDMRKLLIKLKQGVNIYKAVKDVLFVDLDVLEKDWLNNYNDLK